MYFFGNGTGRGSCFRAVRALKRKRMGWVNHAVNNGYGTLVFDVLGYPRKLMKGRIRKERQRKNYDEETR